MGAWADRRGRPVWGDFWESTHQSHFGRCADRLVSATAQRTDVGRKGLRRVIGSRCAALPVLLPVRFAGRSGESDHDGITLGKCFSLSRRPMDSIFATTIVKTTDRPGLPGCGGIGGVREKLEPISIFLHREDSEPERVAIRNRLAPTQPFSSLTILGGRPTGCRPNRSFRSDPGTLIPSATIAASRCGFTSRSIASPGGTPWRKQTGGRKADGFRRTIGFVKNQRGVWEHLK